VSELQDRNRAVWSAGDWDAVAEKIKEVGPRLLDRVRVEPGMRVLDVGTGSGSNVAIPAAQRGGDVVGLDLTDVWFDAARRRAADAGVEIEWVVGDAEALPFEDASFDRVLSTFGHMFAPHHRQASQELLRVCKPGGVVGFTTWLTESFSGALFRTIGAHAPPPPEGVGVPPQWGDREHVRETLAPYEPEFGEDAVIYEWDSSDGLADFFIENFGPLVTLRAALPPDRVQALDDDLRAMLVAENEAEDGGMRTAARYLVTVVQLP
jgi:SAM-dependent methyltransferase